MKYDRIIAVDWSARSKPSPAKPTKDAIFMCVSGGHPTYHRTRYDAMIAVHAELDAALAKGERVLIGFDFSFGYPDGLAKALTGSDDAIGLWKWLSDHIQDAPDNSNNRWDVAKLINARFKGVGPFWGCPASVADDGLPAKGLVRHGHGMEEKRAVERAVPSAQTTWKLFTTGSVGSQALLGMPYLWKLKQRYGDDLAVWPQETRFTTSDAKITLVEIYPSLKGLGSLLPLQTRHPEQLYDILDARQVRDVCDAFGAINDEQDWDALFSANVSAAQSETISQEGWILGAIAA